MNRADLEEFMAHYFAAQRVLKRDWRRRYGKQLKEVYEDDLGMKIGRDRHRPRLWRVADLMPRGKKDE